MNPAERIYGISSVYADRGQFMPEDLEEEAKNTCGLFTELLKRPKIKNGNYSEGFEGWKGTSFSYDSEHGTICIDIGGYVVWIIRGEGGEDNFKTTSVDLNDKAEGAFKIIVEDEDAFMNDVPSDSKTYVRLTLPRKED